MDDEHPGGSEDVAGKGKQPSAKDLLKESTVEALYVVRNSREVMGRPRQVVVGAMLTTSLAFLIGLLGVQRLDRPLLVAAVGVGVAVPLLFMDFVVITLDYTSKRARFLVNVISLSAYICEGLGGLGVAAGLAGLLWHLGTTVVIAAGIAFGLAVVMPYLLVVGIVLWIVVLALKARSKGVEFTGEDLVRKSRFLSSLASKAPDPSET